MYCSDVRDRRPISAHLRPHPDGFLAGADAARLRSAVVWRIPQVTFFCLLFFLLERATVEDVTASQEQWLSCTIAWSIMRRSLHLDLLML